MRPTRVTPQSIEHFGVQEQHLILISTTVTHKDDINHTIITKNN